MGSWPHAVTGGALAVLVGLALGASLRAGTAWVWGPTRAVPAPDRPEVVSAAGEVGRGGRLDPVDPRAGSVRRLRAPAGPSGASPRKVTPLAEPPPGRVLVDVLHRRPSSEARPPAAGRRVGPGRDTLVLFGLPAGAGLADLLRAAGLPPDLSVAGAPPPNAALPVGARLVVEEGGPARLGSMPMVRRLRLGLPLDLNAASAADLTRLPGIGRVLAARIVAEREQHGPFRDPDALLRIRGIGTATLARIRDHVVAGVGLPVVP